jgi:osmotically-inducible protein OsmY
VSVSTRNANKKCRGVAILTGAMVIAMIGCAARQPIVERDDASISNDVRARLAADTQAGPSDVTVDTKGGIVRLTGAVATDGQRNSVERIARDTPGVHSVDNNVRFGGAPGDVKATTP